MFFSYFSPLSIWKATVTERLSERTISPGVLGMEGRASEYGCFLTMTLTRRPTSSLGFMSMEKEAVLEGIKRVTRDFTADGVRSAARILMKGIRKFTKHWTTSCREVNLK